MPQFTPVETLDDGCVLGTSISRKKRIPRSNVLEDGEISGFISPPRFLTKIPLQASATLNAKPTNFGAHFWPRSKRRFSHFNSHRQKRR